MCAKIDKKLENGNIYTLLDIYKSYFLRFKQASLVSGVVKKSGLKGFFRH